LLNSDMKPLETIKAGNSETNKCGT
ncbi:MAG: hypothetical protein RLZZ196_2670, partial [Bacteroidota bacterium]